MKCFEKSVFQKISFALSFCKFAFSSDLWVHIFVKFPLSFSILWNFLGNRVGNSDLHVGQCHARLDNFRFCDENRKNTKAISHWPTCKSQFPIRFSRKFQRMKKLSGNLTKICIQRSEENANLQKLSANEIFDQRAHLSSRWPTSRGTDQRAREPGCPMGRKLTNAPGTQVLFTRKHYFQ